MSSDNTSHFNFDNEITILIKSIADENELANYNLKSYNGSMKGDGYLGVITFVDIFSADDSDKQAIHLIVKTAIKGEVIRKEVPIAEAFQREIYMYSTVIPSLNAFLQGKGLQPFSSFAKCFKTNTTNNNEALILENLKATGFKLWERRMPMNEEHVAFVLKECGRFHALSFAMKDQEPLRFKTLTENMGDPFDKLHVKDDFTTMLTNECKKVADLFNTTEDAHVRKVLEMFIHEAAEFFKGISRHPKKPCVIVHGDCWTSNMLFKYDGADNIIAPTEVCFIDLQLARLAPPVLDVAYFFYTSCSQAVLDDFQHYLDVYYSSLQNDLNQLGTNPENVYPYAIFVQQWKECAKYGLLAAMFKIKMMLSENDEVVDFSGVTESGQSLYDALEYNVSKCSEYNERIKSIVVHFVKNGFL